MIPKILHMIWVGDEHRRPERCMRSWTERHPGWTVRIWGNDDLAARNWVNAAHMRAMATREWNGVADMMRWEILLEQGGVLVDADSYCVQPLPEWLLECEAFACWENELVRPGLIAAGYFGTIPGNPFLANLVEDIRVQETVVDRMAWESVGPLHLTGAWKRHRYMNLTVLPSHFFIPRHFTGATYRGGGPVFARQEWGSTLRRYQDLAGDGSGPGQAFLHAPDWGGAEWVEVLLAYLEAFGPGEPVTLVLVVGNGEGAPRLADAEAAVLDIVRRTGREAFPDVVLVDDPADLPGLLERRPMISWVPAGMGNARGFRGSHGERFGQARRRLAGR